MATKPAKSTITDEERARWDPKTYGIDPDVVARLVVESRAAHGLPPKVEDTVALDKLARIWRG